MNFFNKKNNGFALVEVLVACSIFSVIVFGLLGAAESSIKLSEKALRITQASFLLEEGAEAIKSIRDNSWTNISSLTANNIYYLSYNTNTNIWSLTSTENNIDSIFTRKIIISDVYRDASSNDIVPSGTIDPYTKKVTITVSFNFSGSETNKTLSFYIADIFS